MHLRDSEDDDRGQCEGTAWQLVGVTDGAIYFGRPVHALAEHTLKIDFADPAKGPWARATVELTAVSARDLVTAIGAALDPAPAR